MLPAMTLEIWHMVINLDMTLTILKPFTTGVMKATTLLVVRTGPAQYLENGVAPDLTVLVSVHINISIFLHLNSPEYETVADL